MSDKIEAFGRECHDILKAEPGPAGLEKVRARLEEILVDPDVIATHLGPDNTENRKVLYEDPELGFLVLSHYFKGANEAPPHDHGDTWAIYGQATGVTEMTEYDRLAVPSGDAPGKAKPVKTYRLEPGQAVAYGVGALHSPKREGDTRLIRMEGSDVTRIKRDRYVRA